MESVTNKTTYNDELIASLKEKQFSDFQDFRNKAKSRFQELGLPAPKSEEYKFTPATRLISKHFTAEDLFKSQSAAAPSSTPEQLSGIEGDQIIFLNGTFRPELSTIRDNNATIVPLEKALESHAQLVMEFLGKHENENDPFAALNSTLWLDGLFIHVAKNTKVEKPLVIRNIHDAQSGKVSAHSRLLIVMEQGSELTVLEKTESFGSAPVFNTLTEEVIVKENASFTYSKIQNDKGDLFQVTNTTIHQANSSRANVFTFTLDGKLIRNNLNLLIDGEGCESHFFGLYLLKGSTLADNHTVVDHRKPNSFSNELYKGLMDDHSKGVFNGKIYVRPHAQKTNAFQSNRNILLSDTATINTKPQLEIWADDVKCSHGCTSGQLDEEALFYLQSRGIPRETAKAMLLYAFAAEVVDALPHEGIKAYIDNNISERLHKNF